MRADWVESGYLPRVWIKNPSAVSASLTLLRYIDLRCSFDLIVFRRVSKWKGVSGGRARAPLWCSHAKCLLSLLPRLRPGWRSKYPIRGTPNVSWRQRRRRERHRAEWKMLSWRMRPQSERKTKRDNVFAMRSAHFDSGREILQRKWKISANIAFFPHKKNPQICEIDKGTTEILFESYCP